MSKFRVDSLDICGDMAVFRLFKLAAVRHLCSLKDRNFTHWSDRKGRYAFPCQILCRSVELCGDMDDFRFFKMAAVRCLGLVLPVFGPPTKLVFVTVQSLVGIGAVVSIICPCLSGFWWI